MSATIIVSNRLPVSIKKTSSGLEVYPSSGGLATGLASYASKRGNLWIGWPGINSDDLTADEQEEVIILLARYNCQPVFLSKKEIDEYYNGYSNSVLWPFFHNLQPDFSNEKQNWDAYQRVNEKFSNAVISMSRPSSTIWVHDYQLMLLPKLLRETRSGDNIGFFLHIPFPAEEHFSKLKQAGAITDGLLGSDLIGFHTKSYAKNFLESCSLIRGVVTTSQGLALRDRAIRVADFPIGIDYVKFSSAARKRAVQMELLALKSKYLGQRVILTVDRLDPTKGFIERLKAYEQFLKTYPEYKGRIKMIMLAVPSRADIKAYKNLKIRVEKLVKQINSNHGTKLWKPIDYMYTSVPFEKLSALYKLADIAFVAPIKDGMNLVAKEYMASKGSNEGVLILSQTAGAAQELKDALLVDPAKPRSLVHALKKAVEMPPKELKKRARSMRNTLSRNTIQHWAGDFLSALNQPVSSSLTPPITELRLRNLASNYDSAVKRLLLLDYDGVLVPHRGNPDKAKPDKALMKTLGKLCQTKGNHVVFISGRHESDLQKWLGDLPATLVAEHGARVKQGKSWRTLIHTNNEWKSEFREILMAYANDVDGAFVEEKTYSLVWHYRKASVYQANKNLAFIKQVLKPMVRSYGLKMSSGHKILEIRDPQVSKGRAAKKLMDKPYDFILAIGDDSTDEEMFRALPMRAFTLKVGPGKTAARYRLQNAAAVLKLLSSL